MEYVVKKKEITLKIEGAEIKVSVPNLMQHMELEVKLKDVAPDKALDVYVEFFVKLGLPKDIALSMDTETFLDFIGYVLGTKKK